VPISDTPVLMLLKPSTWAPITAFVTPP